VNSGTVHNCDWVNEISTGGNGLFMPFYAKEWALRVIGAAMLARVLDVGIVSYGNLRGSLAPRRQESLSLSRGLCLLLDLAQVSQGTFELVGQVLEPQHCPHPCQQFPFVDGLAEEVIRAAADRSLDIAQFV